LLSKCNLYRYIAGGCETAVEDDAAGAAAVGPFSSAKLKFYTDGKKKVGRAARRTTTAAATATTAAAEK
jgi:hypothetical protein